MDERVVALEEAKKESDERFEVIENDIDKLETALEQEVADRIAADEAEAKAREEADALEKSERIAADEAEAKAREEADALEKAERIAADEAETKAREEMDEYHLKRIEENELEVDDSLTIVHGDHSSEVPELRTQTKLSVKLPSTGMIKVDEEGLYIDGNFNFGDDYKINN